MSVGDFTFPPIQMMDAMLSPVFSDTPLDEYSGLKRRRIHAPLLPSSGVYLPTLGRTLPHTWFEEVSKSDVAAKRDDAEVPIHFWDKRITLVFPCLAHDRFPLMFTAENALRVISHAVLGWTQRRLYIEFCDEMMSTHQHAWLEFLCKVREGKRSLFGRLGGLGVGGLN